MPKASVRYIEEALDSSDIQELIGGIPGFAEARVESRPAQYGVGGGFANEAILVLSASIVLHGFFDELAREAARSVVEKLKAVMGKGRRWQEDKSFKYDILHIALPQSDDLESPSPLVLFTFSPALDDKGVEEALLAIGVARRKAKLEPGTWAVVMDFDAKTGSWVSRVICG